MTPDTAAAARDNLVVTMRQRCFWLFALLLLLLVSVPFLEASPGGCPEGEHLQHYQVHLYSKQ